MLKIPCGGFKLDENSFTLDKEVLSASVSWDGLKDKPFYEETKIGYLLPETILSFEEGGVARGSAVVPLEEGKTYIVTIDETEYKCVASTITVEGLPAFALGDGQLLGGVATNDPFGLVCLPPEAIAMGAPFAWGFFGANGVTYPDGTTLSIQGEMNVIKQIDKKFIPGGEAVFTGTIDFDNDEFSLDNESDAILKFGTAWNNVISGGSAVIIAADVSTYRDCYYRILLESFATITSCGMTWRRLTFSAILHDMTTSLDYYDKVFIELNLTTTGQFACNSKFYHGQYSTT